MPAEFTVASGQGTTLSGIRWDTADEPVAAVLLIHGMGEHIRRYTETAEALADDGYVVYGYDHRGHGRTRSTERDLGDLGPGGWQQLVADIGRMVTKVRELQPDLPLVLIAHSMGSFATQQYLLDGSNQVDAVILSGTAALDGLEPALDLDAELDLTSFNAPFAPARTDFDWLSRDDTVVDEYIADPLCGFGLDVESVRAMFAGARALSERAAVAKIRPDLPILIAVGSADPVGGGGALVDLLAAHYRNAGLEDVSVRVWSGARHEILNETNRAEIRGEILDWLAEVVEQNE